LTCSPIALFCYKRLDHLKQVILSLLENEEAPCTQVIIFSDGPKGPSDYQDVLNVRKYLSTITGFKSVSIIEQQKNLGLANSIIMGVSKVLEQFENVIVLEDDIVVSKYFLKYMNQMLSMYKDDTNVASIHAYVYPIKNLPNDCFFLKGADCWGWGTWRRAWKFFESDGKILLNSILEKKRVSEFNFKDSYPFLDMLNDQINGRNNSWAIRWNASAFVNDMLTLYPSRSFVKNIGLDNSGTHCEETTEYDVELVDNYLGYERIKIEHSQDAYNKFAIYFSSNKNSFFKKIFKIIKRHI